MISIIVPIYNVEKFLPSCIDSVLSQTYMDWEMILVDDGSQDSSGEICDEYVRRDERIRAFHIPNGGPSNARNHGIGESRGDYLCFIDSDDWVEKTYLENLYRGLGSRRGVGLVVAGHKYEDRDKPGTYKIRCVGQNFFRASEVRSCYGLDDIHEILPSLMSFGFPHGKLYYAATVKNNDVTFPPAVRFCEDVIFMLRYLNYVEWVSFIPEADYHYMYRKGDISLIQRFHSPDSEYECYTISKSCYEKLYRKFCLTEKEKLPSMQWTSYLLWRSIRTLYETGERKIHRQDGIRFLKTLNEADYALLTTYTSWIRKKNMLPIRLLRRHHYVLADLWLYYMAKLGKILKN